MNIFFHNQAARFIIVAGFPVLGGCLATYNLINDPSVDSKSKTIALRIVDLVQTKCITYSYEQGTDRRISGDMRIAATPEVKRLLSSSSGWWKSEVLASGVWDSVYYFQPSQTLICGEKNWQQSEFSRKVEFKDIK